MTWREFITRTASVAFDPAIVLFCALIALPITAGLGLTRSYIMLVPGILFLVFSTSALMKYATVVSRALALGNPVPSAGGAVFDYLQDLWAFAPWLALVMLNGIGIAVGLLLGKTALVVFLICALPLVPAAIAVISVNRNPLSLFRLPSLLRVVLELGQDYLKILAGWLLLGLLAAWLRAGDSMTLSYLAIFIGCLQVMYLFVSTGVTLFHHHRELEIPIQRDTRAARQQQSQERLLLKERRNALDQAYAFFSRDNNVGGLQRLREHLTRHDDDETWEWFIGEMRGWDLHQPAQLLARNYLPRLLRREDRSAALRLLIDCLQRDPDFEPHPDDRGAARELLRGHDLKDLGARWY